jgi:catechol 2,3-dioxygenase-like lactoylglutathione lyase family enzyme
MEAPRVTPNPTNRQPTFEARAIQRIALRVSDLRQATDFYKIFGTEVNGASSKDRKTFDIGDTVLELIPAALAFGLDSFTIAVRNFDPISARRVLRARGIHTDDRNQRGHVYFRDPDGNWVGLTSA